MSININVHGKRPMQVGHGHEISRVTTREIDDRGDVQYVISETVETTTVMRGHGGWYINRFIVTTYDDGSQVANAYWWPIKGNTVRSLDEPSDSHYQRVI